MYFGHPINVYGTELEKRLLEVINGFLKTLSLRDSCEWVVENPNQPCHQEGYKDWATKTGKGMDYYYHCVLPGCVAGIFLPFRDGKWGAGVFGEAKCITRHSNIVWEITHDEKIARIECICDIPALSVEETRKRIRDAAGQPLPF